MGEAVLGEGSGTGLGGRAGCGEESGTARAGEGSGAAPVGAAIGGSGREEPARAVSRVPCPVSRVPCPVFRVPCRWHPVPPASPRGLPAPSAPEGLSGIASRGSFPARTRLAALGGTQRGQGDTAPLSAGTS